MGQMKTLAQRQGRLNQEMPGPSQGGSMSMEERQALSRLKAEQQAIQQGVDQLHSEIGDERNMLGRLDKLAEEMKRVVEAMEHSEVSEATRERQRRIYTRMLDFQHSLEKQDFKDQRKARFGDDILHASPDQLDLIQLIRQRKKLCFLRSDQRPHLLVVDLDRVDLLERGPVLLRQ